MGKSEVKYFDSHCVVSYFKLFAASICLFSYVSYFLLSSSHLTSPPSLPSTPLHSFPLLSSPVHPSPPLLPSLPLLSTPLLYSPHLSTHHHSSLPSTPLLSPFPLFFLPLYSLPFLPILYPPCISLLLLLSSSPLLLSQLSRAEAWLVLMISHAADASERELGGYRPGPVPHNTSTSPYGKGESGDHFTSLCGMIWCGVLHITVVCCLVIF